jgi:hypothetical protein
MTIPFFIAGKQLKMFNWTFLGNQIRYKKILFQFVVQRSWFGGIKYLMAMYVYCRE